MKRTLLVALLFFISCKEKLDKIKPTTHKTTNPK